MSGHVTQVFVWAVPGLRPRLSKPSYCLRLLLARSKESQDDSEVGDCAYSSEVLSAKRSYASIFLKQICLLILFCLLSTGWVCVFPL